MLTEMRKDDFTLDPTCQCPTVKSFLSHFFSRVNAPPSLCLVLLATVRSSPRGMLAVGPYHPHVAGCHLTRLHAAAIPAPRPCPGVLILPTAGPCHPHSTGQRLRETAEWREHLTGPSSVDVAPRHVDLRSRKI